MNSYHADVTSWSNHYTFHFEAKDNDEAFIRASAITDTDFPDGYDFVRLWGEGKLLWVADEGWLPEHDAI